MNGLNIEPFGEPPRESCVPDPDAENEFLEKQYAELAENILRYNPTADMVRVRMAYELAREAHAGQKRRDGRPYVTHAIATAEITAELGLDSDSVIAALLHDVIEDTSITHAEISKKFGASVADIVEGVTKLSRVNYASREEAQMENLRKMLMAMAKDIRVILIKIADRLHNMRTMNYQTPEKQRAKSLETMEVYAPIAHRLGMQKVKWELEDWSIFYLDHDAYGAITAALRDKSTQFEELLTSVEAQIQARMDEWSVSCEITSRIKHVYSIYRKLYAKPHTGLSEIFDLVAIRVIVNNISDCYNVLGHIHDMFRPIPGRFKDYIGTPKPNLYQSIHTTVIGAAGIPFEVQIRTWDMHRVAEYGIAAHWKYKSGIAGVKNGDEEKFAWVRRLLEAQADSDAQEFVSGLKIDMFTDEVFVFTPNGDVINLPAGATPIDFAYSIHSAIGNRLTGAKVNGRIVPLGHVLENGDIVEALTSKSSAGPSRNWLKIVKSPQARSKIKQWFKREKRDENIAQGREQFESELKRTWLTMADLSDPEILSLITKRFAVPSLDDLFAAIGYGGMTASRAVNRIRDEVGRLNRVPKNAYEIISEIAEKNELKQQKRLKDKKGVHGVLVEGIDSCLIKFSRCCTPVPGDDIVGFITRGYGVSVHRKDCQNYLNSVENGIEPDRWIAVSWADAISEGYTAVLTIAANDRSGLVVDIASSLNSSSAKVLGINFNSLGGDKSIGHVTLEVTSLAELKAIMGKIQAISGVSEVVRG